MIIDTTLIEKKIMEGDKDFVAEHYGLKANTVKAYQSGQRDWQGMSLSTAARIMEIIHNDMKDEADLESWATATSRVLFVYGSKTYFQDDIDRNLFTKTEENEKVRQFRMSDQITAIIEMSVSGYNQLKEDPEVSQSDLDDVRAGIDLQYFTEKTWEVEVNEDI